MRAPPRHGGDGARSRARVCALVSGLAAAAALAGCAVEPRPLTPEETSLRVETDLARLAANRPELDGPLTLHGAMALALAHNLDARVEAMARDVAMHGLAVARRGMAPGLAARYGIESRSNERASSSRSVRTGLESLSASTSTDRHRRSGQLAAVWHALDFGVSWYGARQQSDRVLIAHERRRRAAHEVSASVRRAWWRAAAGERALTRLEPLLARVRGALAASERLASDQMQSPIEALYYQRALLEAVDELERQRRESRLAKIELATLIGMAPDADYSLALPGAVPGPRPLSVSVDELAALALAHRPELREGQLDARIRAAEVKKAMLRLLPGLELNAGAHHDANSFLVNNDWLSLGAAVSVNLTELFTAPASIAAARAERDLSVARREALSMAVLSQLYIAVAEFEESRTRHATAERIADVAQRLAEALRSGGALGAVDRLRWIRGEVDAQRALLARDLSLAGVEDSFGRIFLAVGADLREGAAGADMADAAAAIAATEEAWRRGEIDPAPPPGGAGKYTTGVEEVTDGM